jgi:hypothetical protein
VLAPAAVDALGCEAVTIAAFLMTVRNFLLPGAYLYGNFLAIP